MNCYIFLNLFLCYIHWLTHQIFSLCSGESDLTEEKKYAERNLYCNHDDTILYITIKLRYELVYVKNNDHRKARKKRLLNITQLLFLVR